MPKPVGLSLLVCMQDVVCEIESHWCTVAVITGSNLPLPLGMQLTFRCSIMEAHGNIEAAAATEHGSESQLIELLSEDAGQTGEYELPRESDAVEPPSRKVKLTLTTSAATEHASPDRTATEHASQDPYFGRNMCLPSSLVELGAMVKQHADKYVPDYGDIEFPLETFKMKDVGHDFMRQHPSCGQYILYACIKACLVIYHSDVVEHTFLYKACVSKNIKQMKQMDEIYNLFHNDSTASFSQFARKHKLTEDKLLILLNGAVYAELHAKHGPASPQQIERAHLYLHRLGECLQDGSRW